MLVHARDQDDVDHGDHNEDQVRVADLAAGHLLHDRVDQKLQRRHGSLNREDHAVHFAESLPSEHGGRQRCRKVCGSANADGNHKQRNINKRHDVGEVEHQRERVPDAKVDHGLLCAEFIIQHADDKRSGNADQREDHHDDHGRVGGETKFLVPQHQLAHDAHRADLEQASRDSDHPRHRPREQFFHCPSAILIFFADDIFFFKHFVRYVIRVDVPLLRGVPHKDHAQDAQDDAGDTDWQHAAGNIEAADERGQKQHVEGRRQVVAHGRVAHDNALFLREPLGDQRAAADIAGGHDRSRDQTHADQIHRHAGGITQAYVRDAGDDAQDAGQPPGSDLPVQLAEQHEKCHAHQAGDGIHC